MGVDDVDNAETFCRGIEISSDWGDDEVDYAATFCQGIRMSSSKFDTAWIAKCDMDAAIRMCRPRGHIKFW